MSKRNKRLALLADLLILGGCVAVSFGVGLFCTAAGVITAGTLAVIAGVLVERGNDA